MYIYAAYKWNAFKDYNAVFFYIESQSNQKTLKWIIDMTIGYPGATPYNTHGMFVGYWPPRKVQIHYRVYPIGDVPTDREGLTKWMYQRYQEKEGFLHEFYTKSKPLDESDEEKRYMSRIKRQNLEMDVIVATLYYLFLLCSFIFFWSYLYSPVFRILNFFLSFIFWMMWMFYCWGTISLLFMMF